MPRGDGEERGGAGQAAVDPSGGIRACIGLGSNVGDREVALARAARLLEEASVPIVARSSLYRTEPLDVVDQAEFLNQVIAVRTTRDPRALLQVCLEVEAAMGRVRRRDKGPREIDLDLLLHGDTVLEEPGIRVPHPRLHLRRFVLVPLVEILPDLVHPTLGLTMKALLDRCPDHSAVARLRS